jgi:uncharacterized protein YeaO (DUF488 family)
MTTTAVRGFAPTYLGEKVGNANERGMGAVHLKRVYDDASPDDGVRVLVDRLWPRGLSREAARIDQWLKDVAPSDALRHWFNHDPERWPEFRKRYRAEIADKPDDTKSEELETLRRLAAGKKPVTLLFAAKDTEHNNAVVLKDWLSGRPRGSRSVKKTVAPNKRRSGAHPRRAGTSKHS